ncbi:MAG: YkvA family protein [Halanaerobiales bacterium]
MKEEDRYYYRLRAKIKNNINKIFESEKLPEYLLLAPDIFYLLIKLMRDSEVAKSKKVKLGVVIAYFITPFDILPEAIMGLVGYIDDVALSAYMLNDLFNNIDPKLIKRHWAGDKNLLNVIQEILNDTDKFINKNIITRLKKIIKRDG